MSVDIKAFKAFAMRMRLDNCGSNGDSDVYRLAWTAEDLIDEVVVLGAENQRLRDDLGSARDWEAWERGQEEIKRLKAEAERAQPVLDAARALEEAPRDSDSLYAAAHWLEVAVRAWKKDQSVGPGGCAGHTKAVAD